jgi:hypothetical protein
MMIANYFSRTMFFFVVGFCLLGSTAFSVQAEQSDHAMLEQAISFHNAGRDGDVSATPQAVKILEGIVKDEPKNVLANTYLGSSYALTARDASNVTDKIRFTNRGLRYLDLAVSIAPEDFVARIVRVSVSKNLPEMFGRSDMVVEDLMVLDKIFSVSQSPMQAAYMVNVYEDLAERAPQQGNWEEKKMAAQELAGKSQ